MENKEYENSNSNVNNNEEMPRQEYGEKPKKKSMFGEFKDFFTADSNAVYDVSPQEFWAAAIEVLMEEMKKEACKELLSDLRKIAAIGDTIAEAIRDAGMSDKADRDIQYRTQSCENDITSLNAEITALKKQIDELKEQKTQQESAEVESLKKEVETLKQLNDEAKKITDELTSEKEAHAETKRSMQVIIDGKEAEIRSIEAERDKLKLELENKKTLEADLKNAEKDLKKVNTQLAEKTTEAEDAKTKNGELNTQLKDVKDKLVSANEELLSLRSQLNDSNKNSADAEAAAAAEKARLTAEILRLGSTVIEHETTIGKLNEQLRERDSKIADADKKLSDAIRSKSDIEEKSSRTEEALDKFTRNTRSFCAVLESIADCPSMADYMREKELTADTSDPQNIIRFIFAAGGDYTLARDIANYMGNYKKQNTPEELNAQEIELIRRTNSFYRERFGRSDGDILFYPDGFSEDCVSGRVEFKKDKMQAINMAGNSFRWATALCVPGYKQFDVNFPVRKADVIAKA